MNAPDPNGVSRDFRFRYLRDGPIVDVETWPGLGGNANGPSLIRAPDWMPDAPGRYLLYFAHHEGRSIRLACSDRLAGPWKLHRPDPLTLAASGFAVDPPGEADLDPVARNFIAAGADGYYPHIASPDVLVDHDQRRIRLYYHGRLQNGLQRTRVAVSANGLDFTTREEILGLPYMRVFYHRDSYYAIAMPAQLYRSADGLGAFEAGPKLTSEAIRHHALLQRAGRWFLVWTRVGDCPERLLISRLHSDGDWRQWRLGPATELHRARKSWEGADRPAEASRYGAAEGRVNQLRDPAIYTEDGRYYLLYAVAGEQGIAIGELEPVDTADG